MGSKWILPLTLAAAGCGPLTPHFAVRSDNNVTVSGTITVNVAVPQLQDFFAVQCQQILGVQASLSQLSACESQLSNNFLSFVANLPKE